MKTKEFIEAYLKKIREKRKEDKIRFLWQQSVQMFDITERQTRQFLSIDGTLIPIDEFNDASNTLRRLRESWILKNM